MDNYKLEEKRAKLVTKLLPYLRKNGLQNVRMDEIAKIMEVSRVTLYRYFSTKEEIVEYILNGFVKYLNEMTGDLLEEESSFIARFQQLFEQSVSLVVYFSDIFLKDLQSSYPEIFERFDYAVKQREEEIFNFYEKGIQKGIFNKINGRLLIKQDEILRGLLDYKYLMNNQLTVKQILFDYYQLKKVQLFRSSELILDDESMYDKIEHLTQKVNKNLFS